MAAQWLDKLIILRKASQTGCKIKQNSGKLTDKNRHLYWAVVPSCESYDRMFPENIATSLNGYLFHCYCPLIYRPDDNEGSSSDTAPLFQMAGDGRSTDDITLPLLFLFHKEGNILLEALKEYRDVEGLLSDKARDRGWTFTHLYVSLILQRSPIAPLACLSENVIISMCSSLPLLTELRYALHKIKMRYSDSWHVPKPPCSWGYSG